MSKYPYPVKQKGRGRSEAPHLSSKVVLTASAGVPGEKSVAGLHCDGIVDLHILTPLHLRADHMGRTVLHTTQILRKYHLRADHMVSTVLHTTQILRKFHLRADHMVNTILHTTQIFRKTGCNMNSCLHCNLTLNNQL